MFNRRTCRAIRPRLQLAIERIQLVRRDRGTKAAGDALLKSAQKALQYNAPRSALQDLDSFRRLIRDVSPSHRAILSASRCQLSHKWFLALPPPRLIVLILEILYWLMNKHSLSCHQVGLIRLDRCIRLLNSSISKVLPVDWGLIRVIYYS